MGAPDNDKHHAPTGANIDMPGWATNPDPELQTANSFRPYMIEFRHMLLDIANPTSDSPQYCLSA